MVALEAVLNAFPSPARFQEFRSLVMHRLGGERPPALRRRCDPQNWRGARLSPDDVDKARPCGRRKSHRVPSHPDDHARELVTYREAARTGRARCDAG